MRVSILNIKYWEFGVNLRTIGWRGQEIEKMVKKHKLRPMECAIFFNNSKEFGGSGTQPPKCRIYWVAPGGMPMTIIPPIYPEQRSYQLMLNEWIRNNFGGVDSDLLNQFSTYQKGYDKYLDRRRKLEKNRKLLKLAS